MQSNTFEIHCKVQYGNEFRRFLLTNSKYDALVDQTNNIFGFVGEEFNIKYMDDEKDMVTVSSDEELAFAIELFAKGVLRLTLCRAGGPKCPKAAKWENKSAKREGKSAQWEAKNAKWENKNAKWEDKKSKWDEKLRSNPQLLNKKIELFEAKLKKLSERKEFLQKKAQENANPSFAPRLHHLNNKLQWVESRLATFKQYASSNPEIPVPAANSESSAPSTQAEPEAIDPQHACFVDGLKEIHFMIRMKKNEMQQARLAFRAGQCTREVTDEKIAGLKEDIQKLRESHQAKTAAFREHKQNLKAQRQAAKKECKA